MVMMHRPTLDVGVHNHDDGGDRVRADETETPCLESNLISLRWTVAVVGEDRRRLFGSCIIACVLTTWSLATDNMFQHMKCYSIEIGAILDCDFAARAIRVAIRSRCTAPQSSFFV
eukprot:m.93803 g.93803  ORF g.93803 m.93803 type:complete len:116 (+) comp26654_c0_seq1:1453-1800(+)